MERRKIFVIIAVIIVLVIGAVLYNKSQQTAGTEQTLSPEEVQTIVSSIRKHIKLPEGEDPLIASVVDVETLKSTQPFYKDAKNGDLLVIYPAAGKAILYDPDADILVNVGPIIVDQSQATVPEGEEGGSATE